MNALLFAHAAEKHTESTTEVEHVLTSPLILSLLAVGLLAGIFLVMRSLNVNKANQLLIVLGYLLGVGIFAYRFAPVLGVIFIATGITLTLGFVLFSIVSEK